MTKNTKDASEKNFQENFVRELEKQMVFIEKYGLQIIDEIVEL